MRAKNKNGSTVGWSMSYVVNLLNYNTMKEINLKSFTASYLHTAAWVTAESDECTDFTKDAKIQAQFDCLNFIVKVQNKLGIDAANELLTIEGNDLEYLAAHDFFLTRNRHGAGFWDKEDIYGEDAAKVLTEIAHEMKETNCCHIRGKKSKLIFD